MRPRHLRPRGRGGGGVLSTPGGRCRIDFGVCHFITIQRTIPVLPLPIPARVRLSADPKLRTWTQPAGAENQGIPLNPAEGCVRSLAGGRTNICTPTKRARQVQLFWGAQALQVGFCVWQATRKKPLDRPPPDKTVFCAPRWKRGFEGFLLFQRISKEAKKGHFWLVWGSKKKTYLHPSLRRVFPLACRAS